MKINKIFVLILFVCSLFIFLSCNGNNSCGKKEEVVTYKDGTYEGRSQDHTADSDGVGSGYSTCTIVIEDNKIVSCEVIMYELDGTIKDENYGSGYSKDNQIKAQKAIQAASRYASQLVNTNSVKDVDAISGATITYSEFIEAVNDALSKAKE